MTIKGAKRNVPHLLQAQQAPICLWSISETLQCQKFRGTVTKSTVSNRVCWSLKVLWGSVSADFRQFQVGREEKKKERYGIDRKSEWIQIVTYRTYKHSWPLLGNLCWIVDWVPIHGILAAPSPPFIDDTKVSRGQSPTRTDITFYVLVALVDTMRLHGIQSSDPVALTSFSSIIRPLSIMVYAAKGDIAIKVMVL